MICTVNFTAHKTFTLQGPCVRSWWVVPTLCGRRGSHVGMGRMYVHVLHMFQAYVKTKYVCPFQKHALLPIPNHMLFSLSLVCYLLSLNASCCCSTCEHSGWTGGHLAGVCSSPCFWCLVRRSLLASTSSLRLHTWHWWSSSSLQVGASGASITV